MSIEQDKLYLEREKFEWEKSSEQKKIEWEKSSEQKKVKWEKEQAEKGFKFRSYVIPTTSILTTAIVAFIGIMSYCQQTNSKTAEIDLKTQEVNLEKEKSQREFNQINRKDIAESRQAFETYLEKYTNELSKIQPIEKRLSTAEAISKRFSTTSPNLIIDYFRSFRDEEKPSDEIKETDVEKKCKDECICVDTSISEYYKRACLMNRIRQGVNNRITLYLFGSKKEQIDIAKGFLANEGYSIGEVTSEEIDLAKKETGNFSKSEVRFFYDQDKTFAETIADRLNQHWENKTPALAFRMIYQPEMSYQNLTKISIVIPDSITFK